MNQADQLTGYYNLLRELKHSTNPRDKRTALYLISCMRQALDNTEKQLKKDK